MRLKSPKYVIILFPSTGEARWNYNLFLIQSFCVPLSEPAVIYVHFLCIQMLSPPSCLFIHIMCAFVWCLAANVRGTEAQGTTTLYLCSYVPISGVFPSFREEAVSFIRFELFELFELFVFCELKLRRCFDGWWKNFTVPIFLFMRAII